MLMGKSNELQLMSSEFALHVKEGLGRSRKKIKPKYFYDHIGSQLFEEICLQPEYYLTSTELDILEDYSPDIISKVYDDDPVRISVLELGSGSSIKTKTFLRHILKNQNNLYYFPIDVSNTILHDSVRRLSIEFPNLRIIGIPSDYIEGITKASDFIAAKENVPNRKLILFLGSSIGNLEPNESRSFLRMLNNKMKKNDNLLVGFDLQKETKILNAAYNDKAGITARFNLNLLARINRDLGGEFNLSSFGHHAFYNKYKKRVEMYLISKISQRVYVDLIGETFNFKENERIHTESSYKYTLEQIAHLAKDSGFEVKANFLDRNKWFDLALLSPTQFP
ncbi:MAG TPA: L-histidine N(alpha)-methyltransferase [Nitrososphaeraceae archaeon]|nr:L-histidine N(alpha)-methyltransferase [Nitrososphaeraceae archaeon]